MIWSSISKRKKWLSPEAPITIKTVSFFFLSLNFAHQFIIAYSSKNLAFIKYQQVNFESLLIFPKRLTPNIQVLQMCPKRIHANYKQLTTGSSYILFCTVIYVYDNHINLFLKWLLYLKFSKSNFYILLVFQLDLALEKFGFIIHMTLWH